ncbi:MAG: dimethylarginine dimethylaminohydrolase family protein [Phycisphaerales bacterium JB038]
MAERNLQVYSETGRLQSVVIGYPDNFVLPEPINPKHEIYHADHPDAPTAEKLIPEFREFQSALESCGVEVFIPDPVEGVPDQLTPRDIGFVMGDTFVLAAMSQASRKREWTGIKKVLDEIPAEKILRVPSDVSVEGGDIILDRGTLFIGLSERTSIEGAEWMREQYAWRYRVQLVPLKELHHEEDILHMDCTFLPVGAHHCLIYPDGFHQMPKCIEHDYEWIEITREEQFELATNVLSVSPTEVISRQGSERVNAKLREAGFTVIEVPFDEAPKGGGSFRCASLPLWRDD